MSTPCTLTELLRTEGSDKWKWYREFDDLTFCHRRESLHSLLEVGIGTMIPDVPSSMAEWEGPGYRPGGSLARLAVVEHQAETLRVLFPFVRSGGSYVIEDIGPHAISR